MDIDNILQDLLQQASSQRNETFLFHFEFETLAVKGVFFARSKTLTIGIKEKNVGWQIDVSNGALSNMIPNEDYTQISAALKNESGEYSNRPFFLKLKSALAEIATSPRPLSPTDEEIKELIRACKTKDKKYDPEGEKPFFDHWRRVPPSNESKRKIQRYFGVEVKEACYKNKVTAVWSAEPKDNSLLFLSPQSAKREIENA
ncbi:hypothetical protein XBLMG947_3846 [Xanthomonas bromi]|uniref:Uncharacterized protein n=1 Tax=Xanthomonas bromi TaxID=56449 RepID=A0A1C3NRN1_9XANT|nr:hypothetical protein [Xanthomonas bromi]SBV53043.1 hypothetical protein XBLMG947_3846 [Xanthomonas bromi]